MNRRLYKANDIRYIAGGYMDSEKYRKKYMAICSICGEEKPLEQMANKTLCKQCNYKMFKESIEKCKKQSVMYAAHYSKNLTKQEVKTI